MSSLTVCSCKKKQNEKKNELVFLSSFEWMVEKYLKNYEKDNHAKHLLDLIDPWHSCL